MFECFESAPNTNLPRKNSAIQSNTRECPGNWPVSKDIKYISYLRFPKMTPEMLCVLFIFLWLFFVFIFIFICLMLKASFGLHSEIYM